MWGITVATVVGVIVDGVDWAWATVRAEGCPDSL